MTGPTVALSVAGSDSSGGAGIQADVKTFMALGVYGATAITAVTAQNTRGVSSVHAVPPETVADQIRQVFDDTGIKAVKTGMLWNRQIIEAVAASLEDRAVEKLVVDPVMASTTGSFLLEPQALSALIEKLMPLALVATPNLQEASALAGMDVGSVAQMKKAAEAIKLMGPEFVLVKGGHLEKEAVDVLFDGRSFTELSSKRVPSADSHGSGCTLSAAIAARLALGDEVAQAVRAAKDFTRQAIAHSLEVGAGAHPVNQGWMMRVLEDAGPSD